MVKLNKKHIAGQKVYDSPNRSTTNNHRITLPETESQVWYATSNTPAGAAAKVATLAPGQPAFRRTQGAIVCVSFDAANTATGIRSTNFGALNNTGSRNVAGIGIPKLTV